MIRALLIIVFGISTLSVVANQMVDISLLEQHKITFDTSTIEQARSVQQFTPKHKKLKVVLLTLLLGHFGVHRIYLGAAPNVPVIYSSTLGGGLGLLPLLDLIAILSTKDLEQFSNNDKVFMWSKKKVD